MSRRRTLIRNVLKLCQKGWLPLLALVISANAPALNLRGDNLQAARNTMSAQSSAQRQVVGTVKTDAMASDQVDLFKSGLNPSDTMSRYLWEGSKTPESKLSRYLWEGSKAAEPKSSRYLWEGAKTSELKLSRYLWEGSKTSEPKLSRYLWEGSKAAEPKLSRYLWEGAKTSELKLSRYLWEGSKTSEPKLSRYLWDGAKTPEINLSRYLWTDEKASETKPAPSALVAMPIAAARGEYGAGFARFLWREFDTALPDTQTKSGLLDELMGQNPPAFLLDSRLQVASLNAMPSPLHQKQQVALTGLNFSAKSAATLEFEGQLVRWSLVNQGLKPLEFSTLDLTVPDGAALTSVVVKQTGLAPIDLGVESSRLSLEGALHPGGSAMVEVTFVEAPSRDESQYAFNLSFKNGQKIEFLSRRNLPIQGENRDSFFPTLIRADELHRAGLTGRGVGVAVIDTGAWAHPALALNTEGQSRVSSFFDAIKNEERSVMVDENGHGSHITSVLASSEASYDRAGRRTGSYHGIAPDVDLVVVKAFNDESKSTYLDVVSAIAYVVKNRDRFNIKVLTLAFQGDAVSHYWQDPINQAVMAAWDAGITVVVSAGNSGPDAMTIGAPGNVPYVITVGAVTDHYTMDDESDDYVASFSSVGPTLEGFAKPEMTAPGGHMMGLIPDDSTVTFEHPEFHDGYHYYLMSGTSQAAAAASGVAALMLQDDPSLSPNDVKCRLMASARMATKDGQHTFSVLQQGAGLIDAVAAVASKETGCANQGLDLNADIAGRTHFKGPYNSRAQIEQGLPLQDSGQVALTSTTAVFHQTASETAAVLQAFNTVSMFDETALKREGQYVTLESLAANNLNWAQSDLESQGYLLNRSFQGLEGLAFDGRFGVDAQLLSSYLIGLKAHHGALSDTGSSFSQAGFIWNLSNPENAGFIWNLSNPENAGFIWNLSNPENAGFIWNLSNPENTGFIWNLSNPENAGFIWNLSNPENAGFIWNLSNPKNAGFIWNLSNPENTGFIWNL
ncbi:MAG: S8 family peptidase [Pseudomonadales bacterium]|nr:S8 family peptidase [Pseudomonadales bacterium]